MGVEIMGFQNKMFGDKSPDTPLKLSGIDIFENMLIPRIQAAQCLQREAFSKTFKKFK